MLYVYNNCAQGQLHEHHAYFLVSLTKYKDIYILFSSLKLIIYSWGLLNHESFFAKNKNISKTGTGEPHHLSYITHPLHSGVRRFLVSFVQAYCIIEKNRITGSSNCLFFSIDWNELCAVHFLKASQPPIVIEKKNQTTINTRCSQ